MLILLIHFLDFEILLILLYYHIKKKIKYQVLCKLNTQKKILHLAEYRNFIADTSLFTNKTNWKPKVKLNEGLNRTLDFIKNNNDQLK